MNFEWYSRRKIGLDKYQRDFIRQIQHLPERVASCSVYIMSGLLPIEAEIHKSQLTLLGNIIRQDCVEREIALRQLAVKDFNSNSWFVSVQEILFQYDLPTAHDLIENPPEKLEWKRKVKCQITRYWENIIIAEARMKSTLRYLNFENYKAGRVHQLWSSAKYNQHSVHKAFVHVKLSLGYTFYRVTKHDLISSQSLNSVLCVAGKTRQWSTSFCGVAISRQWENHTCTRFGCCWNHRWIQLRKHGREMIWYNL